MWDVDGPARRIDTRAPQCFVDEEVAQPGDARLVHEDGLDRRGPCTEGAVQLLETERERVGAEARLVGFDLDRAEPSRVAQEEVAAVGKVHAKAMPRSDSAVARVDEWIAGFFVVMGPWWARQLLTFGSISPTSSSGAALWIRTIHEWNSITANPSLSSWLAQGVGTIASQSH